MGSRIGEMEVIFMKKLCIKTLAVVIAFVIGFAAFPIAKTTNVHAQPPTSDISVVFDGSEFPFGEQGPVQIAGRTFVPLKTDGSEVPLGEEDPHQFADRTILFVRGFFEIIGFVVEWEAETETAVISNNDYVIRITVGSYTFTTNGIAHELDVPAQYVGQTIMVPIGLPLESMGFGLYWDGATQTAYITSPLVRWVWVDWEIFNNLATDFINLTAGGDFEAAVQMFDETMAAAIGVEELQTIWEELTIFAGEFLEIHEIRNTELDGFFIAGVIAAHENIGFVWNIVFTDEGLIAGLYTGGIFLIPGEAITEIIDRNGFTEEPVIVGEETDFPLMGILSVPTDMDEPVPAVVIVAGSGPSDMDGTLFGNAPYRDIAMFLASNGIAVIRHDKRTFTHADRINEVYGGSATVWHESIEDALLATDILRNDPRIDSDRIFIIGHSLGGILAPRIHEATGDFAGLILMAASPRSLMEVLIEQHTASIVSGFEAEIIDEETKISLLEMVADMEAEFLAIAILTEEEAKNTFVESLGLWAYYLLDLETHPFSEYILRVQVPILVLQGGRDFQVLPDVDFLMIKDFLEGNENATFILFDGLNHMFMPTTAENFVEHATQIIQSPGNVYEAVLRAIVEWIGMH